ncbi:MAG: sigma-70 family RNA polymerase sigma factor [bacterium]
MAGQEADWSEERLVRGLSSGDDDAIRHFLERTHHAVWCMAARVATDPDVRRDWSHEVLLGILHDVKVGRFEYRGPGSFWGWFRKRAYFRLLDEYRRRRLHLEREAPGGDPSELPEPTAWTAHENPEDEFERVRLRAAVEQCLEGLANADQRAALEGLLFEDLPYDAIATRLAAPLNTVRAWIRRGRLALRKCLVETLGLQPEGSADPFSNRKPDAGS